jgi:hypothetical protein
MAGSGNAQLIWEPTAGVYKLTCDINWHNPLQKGLAEFLKAKIPHHHRSWTPATKTWAFEEQYFHSVKGFIELAWPDNNFIYTKEQSDEFMRQQQQAEQSYYQQTVHSVDRYVTQFLNILIKHCIISNGSKFDFTKDKDYEDAKHLYKKACFKLHPDRNPAYAEDMSKLNEAWSIIKTEKEAKNAVS